MIYQPKFINVRRSVTPTATRLPHSPPARLASNALHPVRKRFVHFDFNVLPLSTTAPQNIASQQLKKDNVQTATGSSISLKVLSQYSVTVVRTTVNVVVYVVPNSSHLSLLGFITGLFVV